MIAVIQTGGKQYIVEKGSTIITEKILGTAGETIQLDKVLLVGSSEDGTVNVGTPLVPGASVKAKIMKQGKKKTSVIRYKRKIRYHRNHGYNQPQTTLMIEEVTG